MEGTWIGLGGGYGRYKVNEINIMGTGRGARGKSEGYLSLGKRCNFMNSLTSFAAGISRIAHNKAKTGDKFSSIEVSEIDSVSSGIVLSITSIIRPTTFVSEA